MPGWPAFLAALYALFGESVRVAQVANALLGAGTDVVICAHVGLDEMAEVRHLLDGSLIGARVWVAFWRIPRSEIPEGEAARLEWLGEQWHRVDRWVGGHRRES